MKPSQAEFKATNILDAVIIILLGSTILLIIACEYLVFLNNNVG